MKIVDRIALILVIIGALNWGGVGLFSFDCVAFLFGGQTGAVSRISLTGDAGPDSDERGNAVGTVYIGLAGPDGTLCRLCHFGKRSRERIRGQSANTAFDLLRRELQK